ncbi:MAG: hypothetical protein ACFB0C_22260 [Leptolyngbyaceae cyanobacterium]
MQTAAQVWTPPAGVTRHAGTAIPEEMDFFAGPPAEIGAVMTADSTLKTSSEPLSPPARIGWAVLIGAIIAAVVWGFLTFLSIELSLTIPLVIVAIIAVLAYMGMGFKGQCSFVGDRGIAEFTLQGSRRNPPTARVLTFQTAAHLYTRQTRRFRNGAYQGTRYSYTWTQRDAPNHGITGNYHSKEGNPREDDPWHFANSAESTWTTYLLKFANQDMGQRGYIEFPMAGNPQIVRVGKGFLEFVTQKGETQRALVSDMRDIKLHSGRFQFKHQDARWWSGKGKYSFAYSSMPNAKLFLMCLDQLAGVRWG